MASRQAKPSRASDVPLALDRVAALAMTQVMLTWFVLCGSDPSLGSRPNGWHRRRNRLMLQTARGCGSGR